MLDGGKFKEAVHRLLDCRHCGIIGRIVGTLAWHDHFVFLFDRALDRKGAGHQDAAPAAMDYEDFPVCYGKTLVCKLAGDTFVSLSEEDLALIEENMDAAIVNCKAVSGDSCRFSQFIRVLRVQ